MNRIILIIFFLCYACSIQANQLPGPAQDPWPFQVLTARSTFSKEHDRRVVILDLLSWNDELSIRDGYALIVHRSGKFLEFSGDTTVVLDSLRPVFAFYDSDPDSPRDRFTRPPLQDLLKRDPVEPATGHRPDLITIYPFKEGIYGPDLCILWKYDHGEMKIDPIQYDKKSFMVEVSDGEDLPLKKVIVRSNSTVLDLQENLVAGEPNDIHLRLWELGLSERPEDFHLVKVYLSARVSSPCRCTTAIDALQVAFELERNHFFLEAEKFYSLAVQFSEVPAYDDLFSRFRKRRGE